MAKLSLSRGGIWIPVTDEDHRADSNPHPGVVVLEGDSRLTNARTPTAHAGTHADGGGDEVDITGLAGFPADATKILDGSGVWRKPSYATVLDPRVTPAGLDALSDEMTGADDLANWSDWDHGGWVTTSYDSATRSYVSTGTANTNSRAAGKYKAAPGSEYVFSCYCAANSLLKGTGSSNATWVGLAAFQDATTSAADLYSVELLINAPDSSNLGLIFTRSWTQYDTPGSGFQRNAPTLSGVWLRMRVLDAGANTTLFPEWSTDGLNWVEIHPNGWGTPGYHPAHFGFFMNCNVNGLVPRVEHKHFRVWSGAGSSAFNYAVNGGLLGS